MKKSLFVLLSAFVLVAFANCGPKDDQQKASPSMDSKCYLMQTGNSGYGQQGMGGMCGYPYQNLSGSGFSSMYGGMSYTGYGYGGSCSSGGMVYSPTKGVGCVDTSRLYASGQVVMYALNQQSMTFTQVNTPNPNGGYGQYGYGGYGQYGGGYGQYGGGYGGYNQVTVMRVCDSAEPCPAGQTCRSPIGGQVNGVGLCYF